MSTTGLDFLLQQLHTVVTAWLHVLLISFCGLRLDDAIRVAIDLRLGANFRDHHVCSYDTFVNIRGTYGLSCKQDSNKLIRHTVINNLIYRALARARIPFTMKPTGLSRLDGKRPDGLNYSSPFISRKKHHLGCNSCRHTSSFLH